MTNSPPAQKPLRVLWVVNPGFGRTFSGQMLVLRKLLDDWNHPGIEFSIFDPEIGKVEKCPVSRLSADSALFQEPVHYSRQQSLAWSIRLPFILLKYAKQYDIINLINLWWGTLLSPLVLHPLGKKVVYDMTLLGDDNPSTLAASHLGKLKLALFKQFDGVTGLSPALVEDCRRQQFSGQLLLQPNFLAFDPQDGDAPDLSAEVKLRLNLPVDSQVILFVGSIISRKGVDIVVEVFSHLAARYPRLRLVLVGPNTHQENPRLDEGFVQAMKTRLVVDNLTERVLWAGLVNDSQSLSDYYRAADIFLFPSRAEGLGNVILEAMAAGLPVVASNLPGVTDFLISSGEQGYLIQPEDLSGFITAVEKLINDRDQRQKLGTQARKTILEKFAFENYCQTKAEFYHAVYNGQSKPENG